MLPTFAICYRAVGNGYGSNILLQVYYLCKLLVLYYCPDPASITTYGDNAINPYVIQPNKMQPRRP